MVETISNEPIISYPAWGSGGGGSFDISAYQTVLDATSMKPPGDITWLNFTVAKRQCEDAGASCFSWNPLMAVFTYFAGARTPEAVEKGGKGHIFMKRSSDGL